MTRKRRGALVAAAVALVLILVGAVLSPPSAPLVVWVRGDDAIVELDDPIASEFVRYLSVSQLYRFPGRELISEFRGVSTANADSVFVRRSAWWTDVVGLTTAEEVLYVATLTRVRENGSLWYLLVLSDDRMFPE